MIASWKIVVIHAYNFSHLCMLVSYFSIDDFSSSVLFFFLFLETTRIFFFLPSSSPLFLSAFLYREFFPFRSRKRNAREWRGVRETNLPIYVSPLGEKEKGLAFEYLRAFQSVVWCYRSVGNGVPYQNGINREPENASRFLNRCLSYNGTSGKLLFSACLYCLGISSTFLCIRVTSGVSFRKILALLNVGEGRKRRDSFSRRILIAIPHGIYTHIKLLRLYLLRCKIILMKFAKERRSLQF